MMHPKNPYASKKPDFAELGKKYPVFGKYVTTNDEGYSSIDFQNPSALRALTKTLLRENWGYEVEMREDRLCPTLANRLDYLLFLLDLAPHIYPQDADDRGEGPSKTPLRFMDIGTGAIAIYPLLLHRLNPTCQVIATEIDEVSLTHAEAMLSANGIEEDRIRLIKASPDRILGPFFDDFSRTFDFVFCNPPFFASQEEMEEGKELKEERPHAAPTAASNELITPGGEVAFVSRMIEESVERGEGCRWYTSLIGKYSSLQSLLRVLERRQIDNYFVKSVKQAKTARWILGWSHTSIRLPDTLTRPSNLIPGTSFARILPPPNTLSHSPNPPIPISELCAKMVEVLKEINLLPSDFVASADELNVIIAPKANTWSRQARRAAARGDAPPEPEGEVPLFRARISVIPHAPPAADPAGDKDDSAATTTESTGPKLNLDWLEGRDRIPVDALWKYLLNKAGLTNQSQQQEQGEKRHREEENQGRREYPEGHWRGGPPGNRGFTRGRGRGGFEDRGGGRGRRGLGFGNRGAAGGGGAANA